MAHYTQASVRPGASAMYGAYLYTPLPNGIRITNTSVSPITFRDLAFNLNGDQIMAEPLEVHRAP